MKVVILAAGKGSRLGDPYLPKPLTVLVDGKSILQHQIEALLTLAPPQDIVVVVGFAKELIMTAFPQLTFVENPQFAEENTSKSLLRALQTIDDDVLWLNGDVVCLPSILKKAAHFGKNGMVVNVGKVAEEEVKYSCSNRGEILHVSKELTNGLGEAVGINCLQKKDLPLFCKCLEQCHPGDYFEKAIELAIAAGMSFWPLTINTAHCVEVDFAEDLTRANKLLKTWQNNDAQSFEV